MSATSLFFVFCLVVVVDGGLHLLKVQMTPVFGRSEGSDLTAINRIINQASCVDVLVSVKEISNPLMLAVLRISDDSAWPQITSQLAARGDVYSSIPLYDCEHFAAEFNQTFNFTTDVYHGLTNFMYLTFPVHGLNKNEYMQGLAEFMDHVTYKYSTSQWHMTCFRGINLPYEMFVFTDGDLALADFQMATRMKSGWRFHARYRGVLGVEEFADTSTR